MVYFGSLDIKQPSHSWSSAWLADRKGFETGDANFYKASHMCLKSGSHWASLWKCKKGQTSNVWIQNPKRIGIPLHYYGQWTSLLIWQSIKNVKNGPFDIIFPIVQKTVSHSFSESLKIVDICVWCWWHVELSCVQHLSTFIPLICHTNFKDYPNPFIQK